MKPAWMLAGFSCVLAICAGCLQPYLGISPPAPRPQQAVASTTSQPAAALADSNQAESGNAEAGNAEAGNDPIVTALTHKIDGYVARVSDSHSTTQPSMADTPVARTDDASAQASAAPAAVAETLLSPAGVTATPPVFATTTAPAANAGPTAAPGSSTLVQEAAPQTIPATVTAGPGSVAISNAAPIKAPDVSQPAPQVAAEPDAPAMVANAPTWTLPDAQKAGTEIAASPAPLNVPVIQPSSFRSAAPADASTGLSPLVTAPMVTVEIVDIRPVIASAAPNASPASANQPTQADTKARTEDLAGVIARIEQSVREQPPHPEDELRLRLLYLAAGMDEKSAEPVTGMDPVQSELLDAIVKAVASSRQAMREPMSASSAALSAADDLRRVLGQQSGVSIPRMALVTKVSSYGDYEQISPWRFKAGADIHAYVYTEVANFRSEPVDGDRLRTLLAESVQVFDSTGKLVWERQEKNIEDRSHAPRRDFFIPFPLKLPATTAPGDYVLKVTIEDRIGGTTDQRRLSFAVCP